MMRWQPLSSGGTWACRNPASTYKCRHKYQHAAADNRILYNTDRLTKVSTGAYKYRAQTAGKYASLTWGK